MPPKHRSLLLFLLIPAVPWGAAAGEVSRKYLCEDVRKPFFSFAPLPGGGKAASPAREFSPPSSFTLPKPPGLFRLFIVGESAAAILAPGEPHAEMLAKALGARAAEAVNCGMGAYESSRILGVLREVLDYDPDLVVVLSGNNESGRAEICPGLLPELDRRSRALRAGFGSLALGRREAEAGVSLAIHEERLRDMARSARAKGVPLMFCTLPANLRDLAPAGKPAPEVRAGIRLLYAGRPAEALAAFRAEGLERDPFALFYSGRALQALGRHEEARASYGSAVHYDEAGDRCSPERNAMIRRVAAEEGACLADLEKAFAGAAANGITGGAELADGVHWFDRYDPFVYGVMAGAAASCLGRGAAPPPPAPAAVKTGDGFGLALSYAVGQFSDRMGTPACADPVSERLVTYLERLCALDCGRLLRAVSDPAKLKKELRRGNWNRGLPEQAAELRRGLALNAAEMLERAGRAREAAALRAAAPAGVKADCHGLAVWKAGRKDKVLSPGERPAGEKEAKELSDSAVKKIGEGKFTEAKALLERAVLAYPEGLDARMNACYLGARAGDAAFGAEHCDFAVALLEAPPPHDFRPRDGPAAALYARAHFRLANGLPGACGDLRSALEKSGAAWPLAGEAAAKLKEACR